MVLLQLLASVAGTLVFYGLYRLSNLIYEEINSSLRDLPGPKSESLFYGNFKQIWDVVSVGSWHTHPHAYSIPYRKIRCFMRSGLRSMELLSSTEACLA
jgi:hypothetical protein